MRLSGSLSGWKTKTYPVETVRQRFIGIYLDIALVCQKARMMDFWPWLSASASVNRVAVTWRRLPVEHEACGADDSLYIRCC